MHKVGMESAGLSPYSSGTEEETSSTYLYAGYTVAAIVASGLFIGALGHHYLSCCCKALNERARSLYAPTCFTVDRVDEEGKTPLFYAAERGDIGAVKALLEDGANLNHLNHERYSPLLAAIDGKHQEVVLDSSNKCNRHPGVDFKRSPPS